MYDDERGMNRQRDLVLATNEFCYVQNQTNGSIKTYVGPTTVSISQQESLVVFNEKTKKFEQVNQDQAKQLFVTAPEGWYITLKNPTTDEQFPREGAPNNSPETLKIGVKINIAGPVSFALYPGQMARLARGHKLRSNQYLLARVYNTDSLEMEAATKIDPDGNEVTEEKPKNYGTGQLLIIKGTEVSFYIPPTGIEVVPNADGSYVRDAVTLERLNYAILKNEDGEKRYVHGPAVVFPKPTETFLMNTDNSPIFRAIELSPISGIYVKVIAPYEEDGVRHELGEELFITGADDGQKIYYPRPEHTIISYGDKIMHYAIAIPAGEGRYVLDRMTGEIETVIGPRMFLPDPRKQVIVKRILTDAECRLLYPGNENVVAYNRRLRENSGTEYANTTTLPEGTKASVAQSAISEFKRQTTFTKPRTITLDTKFEGAVSVDIWTGYAINVVSKTGQRQVVVGPTTRLLDYDETVEALQLSTGKPKTTDRLETVAFLRIDNNKISDIINAQTKDYVNVRIKVSYVVDFLREHKDKWFSIENYVKFLCDRERTAIKKAIKEYSIQELHANYIDIVTGVVLGTDKNNKTNGHLFIENGMLVKGVEVLTLEMDAEVERIVRGYQVSMVRESLRLTEAQGHLELKRQIAEAEREELKIDSRTRLDELAQQNKYDLELITKQRELDERKAEAEQAAAKAKEQLQETLDAISYAELARADSVMSQQEKHLSAKAEIEKTRQHNYAEAMKIIFEAISPDLVAALTAKANADILIEATQNMSPWAIAQNESVTETVNRLLRGTTIENVLENLGVAATDYISDDADEV
ncbi:MAG: hypothetical protein Q4F60_03305, partial [Candidatus Saccharibacteria bacterium]|nr:hypothetical protein [Candidatus Saccharibacteria bacterium]